MPFALAVPLKTVSRMLQVFKETQSVYFVLTSDKFITDDDAISAQQEAGYHPAGYGFYSFKCEKIKEDSYRASWYCGSSCD